MSDTPLFDLEEGRRRRDEGMESAETHSQYWQGVALTTLEVLAHSQEEVTADDLRQDLAYLDVPEPHNPNAWGTPFRKAAKAGIITRTDRTVQSKRPAARARYLTIWKSNIWKGESK